MIYIAIWSKLSKYKIFYYKTKASFNKHVFQSKKLVLSNTNSLEEFVDRVEFVEFT